MKKRMLMLTMALVMVTSSFAGCSSLKTDETMVTVNDTKLTAGEVNFFARYTQAQYETYYAAYFGGEDMWSQKSDKDKTYEDTTKEAIIKNLETMLLLEEHMNDYNVSITDADKELVKKAAKSFAKENKSDVKDAISASDETVERILTLMAIEQKMRPAIQKDVDMNVSDDEAKQKAMQYIRVPITTTDESGASTKMSDDEKNALKEQVKAFDEKAKKDPSKFAELAEAAGYTSIDGSFDKDSETFESAFVTQIDKLDKDQVSGVIEGEDAFYVAHITSLFDKDATEQKKEQIIEQRKQDLYDKVTEGWLDDAKKDVNKKLWKKISFTDVSVKVDTSEADAAAAEAQEQQTTDTTDTSQ